VRSTNFCAYSFSVRPHASKIVVRFYRAEFSHSLGHERTLAISSDIWVASGLGTGRRIESCIAHGAGKSDDASALSERLRHFFRERSENDIDDVQRVAYCLPAAVGVVVPPGS
jgi:hypothetical protein